MTILNIHNAISNLNKSSAALASHFSVEITPPFASEISDTIRFRASAFEFPGRGTQVTDNKIYGPARKFVVGETHSEVTMTILLSEDFREKVFLEDWQDLAIGNARTINGPEEGMFDIGYYNNYTGTINVIQHSVTGEETYSCQILEAFPNSINPLAGDWSTSDFHKLSCTFAYRYFID